MGDPGGLFGGTHEPYVTTFKLQVEWELGTATDRRGYLWRGITAAARGPDGAVKAAVASGEAIWSARDRKAEMGVVANARPAADGRWFTRRGRG